MSITQVSPEPPKNVYYLAISATQKCIRRSDVPGAMNFAKVAWQCDPKAAIKRAWTWFTEDCGMNWEAACQLRRPLHTVAQLIDFVKLLAEGPKNRDSAYGSLLLGNSRIRREAFTILTNNGQSEFANALVKFPSMGVDCFASAGLARKGEDASWLLELAEDTSKRCRDGFGLGLPFFLSDMGHHVREPVNEVGPLTKFDGFLPLEAVDMHTRPGSAAMTAASKRVSGGLSSKQLGNIAFFCEGWLLRDMQTHVFPFWRVSLKLTDELHWCSKSRASQFYSEDKTILDDCRCWALNKTAHEDVQLLKKLYLENWVGV